ncbi:MAG: CvpA family protein [Erysipelotrichaceae bacterium]|nr:CvpA family protein [Erysipelotrichaceae bacterium]
MAPKKAHFISLFLTIILWVCTDYLFLPAYNLHDAGFIVYMFFLLGVFTLLDTLLSLRFTKVNKTCALVLVIITALFFVLQFLSSEFLNAKRYRDQIQITEVSDFSQEFDAISIDSIPVVDKDTAIRLGEKQIGKQAGLGSQYDVSETYTLISSGKDLLRISPLEHQDFYKWFQNSDAGIPGYIRVNVRDANDVELVMLDEGIIYSPTAYFHQNLLRHVRFSYRTEIFSDYSFELDDEGNPYWIISVVEPEIGWFGGLDATAVIVVDPFTGEMIKYEEPDIPSWIDRVQPTDLAWAQIDNWGYYVNGLLNTFFGQKDMIQTTDGYNYVNIDTDTYIFSGLTSVGSDQSISGFALINLRTKEASYIKVGGANEYSAMSSAEGQVQHLGYRATFPILLNVGSEATYFISLKDAEELVKMYSFVNVSDYSIVGVGETVNKAYTDYIKKLSQAGKDNLNHSDVMKEIKGTISSVNTAIIDGSSWYYITLENTDVLYMGSIELSNELPLTKVGDQVKMSYIETEKNVVNLDSFDNLSADYQ